MKAGLSLPYMKRMKTVKFLFNQTIGSIQIWLLKKNNNFCSLFMNFWPVLYSTCTLTTYAYMKFHLRKLVDQIFRSTYVFTWIVYTHFFLSLLQCIVVSPKISAKCLAGVLSPTFAVNLGKTKMHSKTWL